jgi:hypothetical protein
MAMHVTSRLVAARVAGMSGDAYSSETRPLPPSAGIGDFDASATLRQLIALDVTHGAPYRPVG